MTIESNPVSGAGDGHVRRFEELEGLRAWLSWSVVGWHLIQYTGLNNQIRILGSAAGVAHLAVEMFIILSGFVVTHLVTTRNEPYGQYITRRAFRLFPIYLIVTLAGAVASGLGAAAVTQVGWANDPGFTYRDVLLATYASQQTYLPVHALLHLGLLQGIVPDSILPYSSSVFVGPAWSLSLEWQFYLVAPFIIAGVRSRRWAAATLLVLIGGFFALRSGLAGDYRLMSVLPAAILLFLTGIVSRLGFQRIGQAIGSPSAVAIVALAFGALVPEFLSIALWIAFFAFLAAFGRHMDGIDHAVTRVWLLLFGSRIARWFGARSYAVYLAHWPILQTVLFLLRHRLSATPLVAAATLGVIIVPLTLMVAELLHLLIERPMIKLGARVAAARPSRLDAAPMLAETNAR